MDENCRHDRLKKEREINKVNWYSELVKWVYTTNKPRNYRLYNWRSNTKLYFVFCMRIEIITRAKFIIMPTCRVMIMTFGLQAGFILNKSLKSPDKDCPTRQADRIQLLDLNQVLLQRSCCHWMLQPPGAWPRRMFPYAESSRRSMSRPTKKMVKLQRHKQNLELNEL